MHSVHVHVGKVHPQPNASNNSEYILSLLHYVVLNSSVVRYVLSLLFLSNIAHDHTTLSLEGEKMAENPSACVQQFRDGVGLG